MVHAMLRSLLGILVWPDDGCDAVGARRAVPNHRPALNNGAAWYVRLSGKGAP